MLGEFSETSGPLFSALVSGDSCLDLAVVFVFERLKMTGESEDIQRNGGSNKPFNIIRIEYLMQLSERAHHVIYH